MGIIIIFFCVFLNHLPTSWCSNLKVVMELEKNTPRKFPKYISNTILDSSKLKFTDKKIKTAFQLKKFIVNTNETEIETDVDTRERNLVLAQISREGILKLESLGNIYKNHLNPNLNISQTLLNVTEEYLSALDTYFNVTSKQETKYGIDRTFYFLDIIESANKIFRIGTKTLFNDIHSLMNNGALEIDSMMLAEETQRAVVGEKKSNLEFICEKFEICRSFPAYSDHVAELFSEILKLPDTQFKVIVNILDEIVVLKAPFFQLFIEDEIIYKIKTKLKHFSKSLQGLRELLSILRETIIRRFKTFRSDEGDVKSTTKAVTILLDLIDKTFEEYGDLVEIDFDNVTKGIKAWTKDELDESKIRMTLINFGNAIVDVLKYTWDTLTADEVSVLLEVIMFGSSDNNIVLHDLFTQGSTFVSLHRYNIYSDLDVI